MMSSRERKKAAALQEKLQILRSITHSHAVINHTLSFLIKFFSLLNFSCACMSSLNEKNDTTVRQFCSPHHVKFDIYHSYITCTL